MKLLDSAGVSTLWGKVKDHVKTSIDSQQFKTINGTSVKGAGDIHIEEDANNYFLPLAANGTRGGIQLGHALVSASDGFQYPLLVDGNEKAYISIPHATPGLDGLMTSEDKDKLDRIQSGANKYSLPTASTTALGGIKTNYVPKSGGALFKVNTDTEGNANTYIPGLVYGNGKYLSEIEFTADSYEHTSFDGKDFHSYDRKGTETCTISLPDKDGTLALTSDLPQVSKGSSYGTTDKGMIDIVYRNIQQIILLDRAGAYNISNWYKNSPVGSILEMCPYGLSGGALTSDISNLFKR